MTDSGPGSLRQAILDAIAAGSGEIDFNISGSGQHVNLATPPRRFGYCLLTNSETR